MRATPMKRMALGALSASMLAAGQGAVAHTLLQTPQIDENTRVYNNLVIGHGCADEAPVIGTSAVFPDGLDSTIRVNGEASAEPLSAFLSNWGNSIRKIQSNDVFPREGVKTDPLGNVVGFWAGGGALGHDLIGLIPFRINAVVFEPTSCARSVTFEVAITDVCALTPINGFSDATVNFWTPAVGSDYEGSESEAAILRVNRTSELPAECGEGVDVVVTPSAAQMNRDMPVVIGGQQIWPQP